MQNKTDLTRCAEAILLACAHHFLLVRKAHSRNDEVLERIYSDRCCVPTGQR